MDTLADNPVAIVTGGARGLGAAIALRLAQDGYDIALLDIDLAACADTLAAIRSLGRLATAVRADVADEDSVTAAVAEVNDALGPALVLINNAGLMRPRVAQKMSLSEWNLVIDVNLRGTFLMSRAVATRVATLLITRYFISLKQPQRVRLRPYHHQHTYSQRRSGRLGAYLRSKYAQWFANLSCRRGALSK